MTIRKTTILSNQTLVWCFLSSRATGRGWRGFLMGCLAALTPKPVMFLNWCVSKTELGKPIIQMSRQITDIYLSSSYRWRTCVTRTSTPSLASFMTVACSPSWPSSAPEGVWRTCWWTMTSNWTGCSSRLCCWIWLRSITQLPLTALCATSHVK